LFEKDWILEDCLNRDPLLLASDEDAQKAGDSDSLVHTGFLGSVDRGSTPAL